MMSHLSYKTIMVKYLVIEFSFQALKPVDTEFDAQSSMSLEKKILPSRKNQIYCHGLPQYFR